MYFELLIIPMAYLMLKIDLCSGAQYVIINPCESLLSK